MIFYPCDPQKLVLCPLRKEELARYQSCYLKADCNNGCKVDIAGRRRPRRFRNLLPVSAVEGTYVAGGLEAPEVAINNRVARVHMEPLTHRGKFSVVC